MRLNMAGSVIMETIKPIVGRQNRSRLTLQYSSAFRPLPARKLPASPSIHAKFLKANVVLEP
jgi:hypothetical protein